jgi:hypothetical protein
MSCAKIKGRREKKERKKKEGRLGCRSQTKPLLCICAVLEGRGCRDKPNDIKEDRK